ncbi:MAG: hypothetical protein QM613_03210 [Micrococcaceae bacterium]
MKKNIRVVALYPKGLQTGGPEAFHQLVSQLNTEGVSAYLAAIPETEKETPVKQYAIYNCPEIKFSEIEDTDIIISPESRNYINYLLDMKNEHKFIWWVSVNYSPTFPKLQVVDSIPVLLRSNLNPLNPKGKGNILSIGMKVLRWRAKDPKKYQNKIKEHPEIMHLIQTEYSRNWVKKCFNTEGIPLIDYKNMVGIDSNANKNKMQIAYSATKDQGLVEKLFRTLPEFNFIGIKDMSYKQVQNTLKESQYFLDFGPQPGNDGLPREAALNQCLVVLANRGAVADNDIDFPINNICKIPYDKNIIANTTKLFKDIAADKSYYEKLYTSQATYRNKVQNEKEIFKEQVKYLTTVFNQL